MRDDRDKKCIQTERGTVCRVADGGKNPAATITFNDADGDFRRLLRQTLEESRYIEVESARMVDVGDLHVYEVGGDSDRGGLNRTGMNPHKGKPR